MSVALAGGLGAWLAVTAEEPFLVRLDAVAGVFAMVLLAVGVAFRFAPMVAVAVVALAAGYVALLGHEVEGLDTRAPIVAAVLFAIAELAYWSFELRSAVADEPGTYFRRAALIAGMLAGVIALGTALLAIVEAVRAGGLAVELAGAAAAVTAVALLALAARRAPS
jgi:hypothetical protein